MKTKSAASKKSVRPSAAEAVEQRAKKSTAEQKPRKSSNEHEPRKSVGQEQPKDSMGRAPRPSVDSAATEEEPRKSSFGQPARKSVEEPPKPSVGQPGEEAPRKSSGEQKKLAGAALTGSQRFSLSDDGPKSSLAEEPRKSSFGIKEQPRKSVVQPHRLSFDQQSHEEAPRRSSAGQKRLSSLAESSQKSFASSSTIGHPRKSSAKGKDEDDEETSSESSSSESEHGHGHEYEWAGEGEEEREVAPGRHLKFSKVKRAVKPRASIGPTRASMSLRTSLVPHEESGGGGVRFGATKALVPEKDDEFDLRTRMGFDEELELELDASRQGHTFRKLHEIYTQTIEGLEQSGSRGVNVEPVTNIFMNVWEAIERSHANVLKLQKKDHTLSVDLSTVMAKTRTLIKLAEDDPLLTATLKGKLETAWGLADLGDVEEKKVFQKINDFKDQITVLNRNIETATKTEGQDTIAQLNKIKHTLETEKANLMGEASKLQSNTEQLKLKREELANTFLTLKDKLQMNEQETQMQKDEIEAQTKRKEDLDGDIRQTSNDIGEKIRELDAMDSKVSAAQDRLAEAEQFVLAQRVVNEEAVREKELAGTRFDKMREDVGSQGQTNEKLAKDLQAKEDELRAREQELKDVQHDSALVTREYEANIRKSKLLQEHLEKLEKDRDSLKVDVVSLEKSLEQSQKKLDENRREVNDLDRERSLINRDLQKANKIVNDHISEAKTHQVAVRNLSLELTAYEKEITQQEEMIARLERERDNYSHEATKLAHQVALRLDDIKKLDVAIFEYQRKLGDVETQLKKQEQILDATEHEKTMLTRTLRETASEIKENSRKIAHLGHQITALKFQLNEKDVIIREASQHYERIQKDTHFFTNEAKRIKRLEYDMERQIDGLAVERTTLGRMVAEIEGEISKQKYYARSAESRRDVYFRKLVGKEQEVKEIWEKWRSLHSTIRIGAYHFRNIMDEIRKLRYLIVLSKKEKLVYKTATRNAQKLKHEIAILGNLISKEICMTNSLKEQMKHPINVHRWRVLECAHPRSYDLVQKSNLLTKRLVERNSLLRNQADDLTLKQQIYCQIRLALNKSPGLEVPENVRYFTHLLAAKKKQLSTLKTELKEAEAQRDFFKYELDGIYKRFMKLKANYFKRMRKVAQPKKSGGFDE